jgi:F-type H+-transporting ATPase subunit c
MRDVDDCRKQHNHKPTHHMLINILAEALPTAANTITGSFTLGVAGFGSAIGIGLIGARMVEAIGRNPATLPKVLMVGILTIALAEAIAIFGLIFAFQGK